MAHRDAVGRNRFGSAAGHGWTVGLVVVFLVTFAAQVPPRPSPSGNPRRKAHAGRAYKRRAYCGTKRLRRFRIDPTGRSSFQGNEIPLDRPFRGGRSLTAAGVPGDPTTYYFGATAAEYGKSTTAPYMESV